MRPSDIGHVQKAELMQRFINLGHTGDDDEFYDWFFDEIVEEFTNGVQENVNPQFCDEI